MNLKRKRVLITGASGFIGGRLAERLVDEQGAHVTALVRNPVTLRGSESLQVFAGDITDSDAVNRAMQGCDAIVHCAAMQSGRTRLDEFRRVNVGGTQSLLNAAREAHVARFIHISTINVHGYPPPHDANADSPLSSKGDFYSISKAEAERAVCKFSKYYHLPITIIRPGCTYGPRGKAWTLVPLSRVKRGSPVLIGRGEGVCNAIYIDNLIDLILLAMKSDDAIGQSFIGTEGRGVSWRDFYGAYARMIGIKHLRSLPYGIALAVATMSEFVSRITGQAPFLSRQSVDFYSHKVVFGIEKSRKLLGYAPRVSFEEGMSKTYNWLTSSGKLPA